MDFNQRLDKLYNLVENYPVLEGVKNWLIANEFLSAPASTKYHGSYEGGLFDHSFNVAVVLQDLTEKLELEWERPESPVIIGLLHDVCKLDNYKATDYETYAYNENPFYKGHGDKSVILLASQLQLTEEEVACIRYHMGAFTDKAEWSDYTNAIHRYPNVLWTHTADMVATHIMEVERV